MFGVAAVFCFLIALLEELGVFNASTLWDWIIGGLLALAAHVSFDWRPWQK